MATVTSSKSPMHIDCTIGQPYGTQDSSYSCGYHTGVDFPATGTAESNPDLYSCCNGEVVYVYTASQGTTPALGNQVQILDNDTGYYFRYCHMLYGSITVQVGDQVTTSTKIGKMGNTGNSTGTHLHLECSTSQSWTCGNFLSPGDVLGFGNTRGTVIKYQAPSPTLQWIYQAGALTQSQMENNAKVFYNFLKTNYNLPLEIISGLLGNIQAESTIEPWRQEVGGSGYGLVQWTPKSTLDNSVQILGYTDETNGDTQTNVLINEIKGTPSSINKWYSSQAFIQNYYSSRSNARYGWNNRRTIFTKPDGVGLPKTCNYVYGGVRKTLLRP